MIQFFSVVTILLLSCMVVLFTFGLSTIVQVYSQIPPGLHPPNEGMSPPMTSPGLQMPKMIQGDYINAEYGLHMVLPPGVQGMETTNVGSTVVTITLGDPTTGKIVNGMNDLPIMEVIMNPPPMTKVNVTGLLTGSNSSLPSVQPAPEEVGCKTLSKEASNVGGKNAQVFTKDCFIGTGALVKLKKYNIDIGEERNVILSFKTPSATQYDSNIGTFDDIVKSIKFTK